MDKGGFTGIDPDQSARSGPGISLAWSRPACAPRATLVLAHGAGAGMDSPFMLAIAEGLARHGVQVVRFEFPYMAAARADGRRRPPDPRARLEACWREVCAAVRAQVAGPLAIGGKSMGGRIASLLADELAVDALVCLGYPFHPVGKPERTRVEHLAALRTRTLIVQGERDPFGRRCEVAGYALASAVQLHWLADGDHDFKPTRRSGLSHEAHLAEAIARVVAFLEG